MNRDFSSAQAKAVFFLLVVALHVGVFLTVATIRSTTNTHTDVTTQFYFVVPNKTREPPRDRRRKQVIGTQGAQPIAPASPLDIATAPQTAAPIDWEEQGKLAVRALAGGALQEKATGLRSDSLESNRKSVFESPLHRSGDSLQVGNGEVITWIDSRNGRCYVTNLPSEVARIDERNIVTICKPQGQPVDTHLLDELRPKYLREQDPNHPR